MITIGITGYPGTGKSTLADNLDNLLGRVVTTRVTSTDSFSKYPWAEQPDTAIGHMKYLTPLGDDFIDIVEGILVARMLRRGWSPDLLLVTTHRYTPRDPKCASIESQVDRALREYTGFRLEVK